MGTLGPKLAWGHVAWASYTLALCSVTTCRARQNPQRDVRDTLGPKTPSLECNLGMSDLEVDGAGISPAHVGPHRDPNWDVPNPAALGAARFSCVRLRAGPVRWALQWSPSNALGSLPDYILLNKATIMRCKTLKPSGRNQLIAEKLWLQ